jgi:hypothetical protein
VSYVRVRLVPSAATADRARRIRALSQARCRKDQSASATRQPPGTISATTAYGPRSRIGLARSASKFMGRSNIAASRVHIRKSPGLTKYRVGAEWHVNPPRPSRGCDTELAIAPDPSSHCGKKTALGCCARASTSVRPVQGSFARASNLSHQSFGLLGRRAVVWSKVARSPERQSLGASVSCTA